jgi:hypothetical protein
MLLCLASTLAAPHGRDELFSFSIRFSAEHGDPPVWRSFINATAFSSQKKHYRSLEFGLFF